MVKIDKSEEARRIWRHIQSEGPHEQAVANNDLATFPTWIIEDKFYEAQRHIDQLRVYLSFSSLCGLMFVVHLPWGLTPLLKTGKSKSVCALFDRYLDTIIAVKKWYREDIFDKKGKAFGSLQQVNQMHRHIHKVMNSLDLSTTETSSPDSNQNQDLAGDHNAARRRVWVSQYDMVVTQWAFVGLYLMYPEKCGHYEWTDEDHEAVIYVWRVLSYFLGIKSEYSIFTKDIEVTRQLCHLIWQDVYAPVLSGKVPSAPQGRQMALDIVQSLGPLLNYAKGELFENYWYRHFGWLDRVTNMGGLWFRFTEFWMDLVMSYLMQWKPYARFRAWLMDRKLDRIERDRKEIIDSFPKDFKEERFKFPKNLKAD